MKHLAAFYAAIDSATLIPVDTIIDDILSRPAVDRFQVPSDLNSIAWAAALGTDLTRAQLVSPSLEVRRMTLDVVPHTRAAVAFAGAAGRVFVPKAELALIPTENLLLEASEDAVGASDVYGLICLKTPGAPPAIPAGDIRVVRAVAAVALTPNEWTTLTPILENDLEPGTYELVGFIPVSATIIAARALLVGQPYRPGVPGLAGAIEDAMDFGEQFYDKLMWESLGSFTHISPPQFQFLASAADAVETIILYLVKTA